ncbi:hypothetical protein, partial [Enterococcus casseliflavus]|uniref:hypothetical protein n=1 Tax=Enterococcus casseliflavus TaxID=37734 RepID=UPI003D144D62
LIVIRALMAAIVTSTNLWWIFIVGNGTLWLFGTIWGRNQVIRGECWLMKRKSESLHISTGTITSQPAHIHIEKSR